MKSPIESISFPARHIVLLAGALLLGVTSGAAADEVVFVDPGSTWKFLPGTAEATSPDTSAWTAIDFDDAAWPTGSAPFGYGGDGLGTDMESLDPPMRGNYTSFFLRRKFDLSDPRELQALRLEIEYDDGAVIWINGEQVQRLGMAGALGDPVAFDDTASRSHSGKDRPDTFDLEEFDRYLVAGENVIAAQVFNVIASSTDAWFDLRLLDPFGPDLTAPEIEFVVPTAGMTVRKLTQVDVAFSEEVLDIDAADLLVNGSPAEVVSGFGAGPYTFLFRQPASGAVELSWATGHGITDTAPAENRFAGGSWSYTLDPDAPPPDVVISEVMAMSLGEPLDEDRERSDWIELHNRGTEPADLSGWALTDERDRPNQWIFPAVTLPPGEYLLVFASGKDRRPVDGGNLHTSFKLGSSGEYLALLSPESPREVVSAFDPGFPEQRAGISFGIAAAGEARYLANPTPAAPNDDSSVVTGFTADPRFSVEHGLFEEPFDLELEAPVAATEIYYTLDGTLPTRENGTLYEAPIAISGASEQAAVTVRAVAYADGLLPSNAVTQTYIFPEHVLRQPMLPDGFPRRWGSAPSVDYGMDPEIVDNPAYTDLIREGLRSIPTVSIVAEVEDIFGPRGIYSNPQSRGVAWERPASVELISPDGSEEGFQIDCGIRILGGASRQPEKSPKHSFRLLFKRDHGPTRLSYKLFPDSPVDSFDNVVFRANFNNSWIHWDSGQRARCQQTRDQWMRDVLRDMGRVTSHGRFVHIYVNGLYWGQYNMVERPNGAFAASYLGGEKEDYDALNSADPVDGDSRAWQQFMAAITRTDFRDPQEYLALSDMLDVPSFVDYMLANFFGSNADWPHHNWYAARRRGEGNPWYFFSWDAERVLEGTSANNLGESDGNSPGIVFQRLRQSPEFLLLVADHAHRHLLNGGALSPEANIERLLSRAQEIEKSVVAETARWGDYRRDVHSFSNGPYLLYTVNQFWLPEQRRLVESYFPARSQVFLRQLQGNRLYPRVGAPVFNQHGGEVAPDFLLEMTLPAGTEGDILFTADGSDPRVAFSGEVSPSAILYTGPISIAETVNIKSRVLADDGWSALNEATFEAGSPAAAIHITEIMYNPAEGETEFIEIANLGTAAFNLSGATFTNGIQYTFPRNTVLRGGEYVVLVESDAAFGELYPGVPIGGVYTGNLENAGEKVTLRDADGETLVSVDYDDEDFWPVGPDGFGWSLVLATTNLDPDDPVAWRASSAPGGSPGAADPQGPQGGVLINEVLAAADAPFEGAIELHNPTDRSVDIGGWYLSDSRLEAASLKKFAIPEGTTVPARGYATFYAADFAADPASPFHVSLDRLGGAVYLAGAGGGDLTGYITGAEYRAAASAHSFGRHPTSAGQDFTALERPTFGVADPATVEEFRGGRGAPNARPRIGDLVINELHYHPADGDEEFIEIHNRSSSPVALFDQALGRGWQIRGISAAIAGADFEFPRGIEVPAGGYLVLVRGLPPDVFRVRNDVPEDVEVIAPYGGALDNAGERIRILRPIARHGGDVVYGEVDSVRYNDRDPWPLEPDGLGPSLERVFAGEYGNEPLNWAASTVLAGTPGRPNTVSPPEGGGLRLPSDMTQDGRVNLTDAIALLEHLFRSPRPLPCGSSLSDPGNRILLDANADGNVNMTDSIHVLLFLFTGGPEPALGTSCTPVEGCVDSCE